jgi:L-aspartate oxidase
MCGGVCTDTMARTNIDRLYAFGETACTGLHGGNRLASNSLLEAVVFAHQAFSQCQADWPTLRNEPLPAHEPWNPGKAQKLDEGVLVSHNWDQIRRLMWNYVGIIRTEKRLRLVQDRMNTILRDIRHHYQEYLLTPDLIELRNIAQIAELIVRCALTRKESRGLHFMADYPEPDDRNWLKDTVISKS